VTHPDARPGPLGTRFSDVRHHRQVDSTNRVAAALAREGSPEGVVVVADHQTAGRGRRGRSWLAPPGSSLLVSVVLRPDPGWGPAALLTVACGLAAADACADAAGLRPRLRWPNDLVSGDRKLGGILAEAVDGGPGAPAVVLGLGVNLCWPSGVPDELAAVAVAAEDVTGRPVDRWELLGAFLGRLEERYAALGDGEGRRRLVDAYRHACETLGRPVRVTRPGGRVVEGTAADMDDDGRLLVASGGTTVLLSAGDVEHLRASPPP
jgi:BirA family biotin operon repressor/biotin-[acetyl-CoA-carboxylase] ligase